MHARVNIEYGASLYMRTRLRGQRIMQRSVANFNWRCGLISLYMYYIPDQPTLSARTLPGYRKQDISSKWPDSMISSSGKSQVASQVSLELTDARNNSFFGWKQFPRTDTQQQWDPEPHTSGHTHDPATSNTRCELATTTQAHVMVTEKSGR